MAILIAAVVFVQTERIARQSAHQNEALVGWSANQENIRFVRETVVGDSLVMPFANLDLSGGSFRGLHFGCSDAERETAQHWHDKFSDPRYLGQTCHADFSTSQLESVDFGGAQIYGADFQRADLHHTRFMSANVSQASFRFADLTAAIFDNAFANRARFQQSVLTSTSFRNTNLTYAQFVDTQLIGTDFTGANLFGAHFTNVSCELVVWPEGFDPASACQ